MNVEKISKFAKVGFVPKIKHMSMDEVKRRVHDLYFISDTSVLGSQKLRKAMEAGFFNWQDK